MPKTVAPESDRDALAQVFSEFNERWREVDWNKMPQWKHAAIYRAVFYGGVQLKIVFEMKARKGSVYMRMWVVGDFRAASLIRLNRFGKKFLREYPAVTLKHQRIRLTEWGAATKKMLKDPYNGPEWMDLALNTTAAGRVVIKQKNKESKEKKNRKLKKRGRKTDAERARLAKFKRKPKPLPAYAKQRVKFKIGVDEMYSNQTDEALRRNTPPRPDQLPFLPAMATIRDVRTAYKPYLDLDSRRNRLHLAFDSMTKKDKSKRGEDKVGNLTWSSDIVHAAILKDRTKHSY